ncbi:hypothetical protein [Henriciella marina]|uniref:hypothetical protein n=1 Tax=Henriciella marina TaxID=453851 RepID=UPI000368794F|nr:hypothetical protein [Henriciella marina]
MRSLIVIGGWLFLLWLGLNTLGSLAPNLLPSAVTGAHDGINRLDWTEIQSPLDDQNAQNALHSWFLGAPLSSRPFSVRMATIAPGDAELRLVRRRLTEHIIRIAPRNAHARLVLAEIEFQDGNFDRGALNISNLLSIGGANNSLLIDALVAMAAQTETRPAIEELLQGEPVWGARLVSNLAGKLDDTDLLIRWAIDYPQSHGDIVRALYNAGEVDEAYRAFLNFLPPGGNSDPTIPFDSRFLALDGSEPFNWRLSRNLASFEPGGGLGVSFFGQGNPTIAQQVIHLTPGDYNIQASMDGNLYERGGKLRWTVQCISSKSTQLALEVQELSSNKSSISGAFEVPAEDCDFQWLQLSGVAGEFPRPVRARIHEVLITDVSDGPAQ